MILDVHRKKVKNKVATPVKEKNNLYVHIKKWKHTLKKIFF
jgi:hypothetical protein